MQKRTIKKLACLLIIPILVSLACGPTLITAPTPLLSPSAVKINPHRSSPTPGYTPPATQSSPELLPTWTVREVPSPAPSAMPLVLPTPSYTISYSDPPADWTKVIEGNNVIYVPPEVTILNSGQGGFLADFPVDPGTQQLGGYITLFSGPDESLNCGFETTPDQAVVVNSDNTEYIFYRNYLNYVWEEQTIEVLDYWSNEYHYCFDITLSLASGSTGINGAPLSAFNLQDLIEFLEVILSTYSTLG